MNELAKELLEDVHPEDFIRIRFGTMTDQITVEGTVVKWSERLLTIRKRDGTQSKINLDDLRPLDIVADPEEQPLEQSHSLPLARQEKIWARQGVELSRATLANWVIQTEKKWLKPLWHHMKQQIRDESVIHADETVVQVLKEPDKPATSESRMWVYASGEYSQKPVRIFEYQPDRKGDRAKAFLRGFSGCLVTDG